MRAKLAGRRAGGTARSSSPSSRRPVPMMFAGMGMEQMDVDLQGMFEKIMPKQHQPPRADRRRGPQGAVRAGGEALIDQEKVNEKAIELAENQGIIFLDELDKVVASDEPRGRRLAAGRAARPAADRRRHDGADALRPRADRPHPVHRRRGVSRGQAERPDAGAAGPLPDPRRADGPDEGRLPPHPHGAEERADASSTRSCWRPKASSSSSPTTRSRRWPTSPSR